MNQQKIIPSLNGLRAVSITLVIGYHLYQHKFLSNDGVMRYFDFIFNGSFGVNIFFVISGFLITTLLLKEEVSSVSGSSISFKKFYVRRILRIFPAYYFLLLIYAVLQFMSIFHLSKVSWISSLTYTKQFYPLDNESEHLWSLSVEEFFYFLWPISFVFFKRYRSLFALVIISVITFARFFQYQYPLPSHVNSIFCCGDALVIGCLFAINYERINNLIDGKRKYLWICFPLVFLSILVGKFFYHLDAINSYDYTVFAVKQILHRTVYALFGNIGLFTNIFISLILIYSIEHRSYWYAFLNRDAMFFLGKLSYSIYLWQQIFTSDWPVWHSFPVSLILVFIFSAALFSYFVIEKPFLSIKKKWSV